MALGEAALHVAQGSMHIDGFPTGDTEDLQVDVVSTMFVVHTDCRLQDWATSGQVNNQGGSTAPASLYLGTQPATCHTE